GQGAGDALAVAPRKAQQHRQPGALGAARIPLLGHQCAAVDRFEQVAPGVSGGRAPTDPPALDELGDRVVHVVVGDDLHRHAEPGAEREPVGVGGVACAHAARAVELGMPGGVGDDVEQRLGVGGDPARNGDEGAAHRWFTPTRRSRQADTPRGINDRRVRPHAAPLKTTVRPATRRGRGADEGVGRTDQPIGAPASAPAPPPVSPPRSGSSPPLSPPRSPRSGSSPASPEPPEPPGALPPRAEPFGSLIPPPAPSSEPKPDPEPPGVPSSEPEPPPYGSSSCSVGTVVSVSVSSSDDEQAAA